MLVFVLGATGGIGQMLLPELVQHGHQVLALARSDASAAKIKTLGADVVHGDLSDARLLSDSASRADAVINLAFDASSQAGMVEAAMQEARAIETLGAALVGTQKPLLVSNGALTYAFSGSAGLIDEDSPWPVGGEMNPRASGLKAAQALAARDVFVATFFFPPSCHRAGETGLIPILMDHARKNGFVPYVGDGSQRWPATHLQDIATLLRLLIEAPAGQRPWMNKLHPIAEGGVAWKDISTAIGQALDLPTRSVSAQDATDLFGFVGRLINIDVPVSSTQTKAAFQWQPKGPSLCQDIEQNY
ncbi:oxidoreductase [Microstroma glucosiphilum]|uniref:Oxidoreductase n=1 Tax=Pseudomicrostroma glucosiphilum TaxID=1684307 RepID=A0A316U7Z6_9BASI|nr:oxidoreductase [Pseudomicrostroma glucosiphilum]PWN19085.1 oxidoreductase [Pseudomicrostroma glucosiphilum]